MVFKMQYVMQTNSKNIGTVLFLHGAGDTGAGILDWIGSLIGNFELPHIKFLFPTAPLQPYTPHHGQPSTVWFDRKQISPDVEENRDSILKMGGKMKSLLIDEVKSGIPLNNIIVGGFSMGGALALNIGYRILPGLAGVFALSSYLNENSGVFDSLSSSPSSTPLFMAHGKKDDLIPLKWGRNTYDSLVRLNVRGQFLTLKRAEHELNEKELRTLMNWIIKRIPERN